MRHKDRDGEMGREIENSIRIGEIGNCRIDKL